MMDKTIHEGVAEGGIADPFLPVFDRNLAGAYSGEIRTLILIESGHPFRPAAAGVM
jgi:hypothetical protein